MEATEHRKLHIGCGPVLFENWLNVDLDSPVAQLQCDIRETLPFASSSVDFIYAEHLIEHVERSEAVAFLADCKRMLCLGGVVRLSTPNLDVLIDSYIRGNIGRWGQLWGPKTACQMMNEGMRSWGHKFLYDSNEIRLIGAEAGFERWDFQGYHQSLHPELVGLETRPYNGELIIEFTKC